MSTALEKRFWQNVTKSDDCWLWSGEILWNGYGRMYISGRKKLIRQLAHRFSFELANGPIGAGLTIDHLCRNRSCVRPSHLEAVTMRENNLRGNSATSKNSRKTECVHGHPFTEENTIIRKDRPDTRECKECARRNSRNYMRRKYVARPRGKKTTRLCGSEIQS